VSIVTTFAVALATLCPASGTAAGAAASAIRCPKSAELPSDPEAEALMAGLEADFRGDRRIVRMDIRTRHTRSRAIGSGEGYQPTPKTLWGIFNGDLDDTRLLYVFSGPGRLAGTTLLMHDRASSAEQDAMWLFLRSFDIFTKLEAKTQRVLVPGTALSYEDSRGFIPLDKYRFSFDAARHDPAASDQVSLLGCPRSESIRENLGYRSLLLQVDTRKRIVLRVEYADLRGRPLKTYTLLSTRQIGNRVLPAEVQLQQHADGFTSTIRYEHWLQDAPPPQWLFEPSVAERSFIERLEAYASQVGLGERLRAELARADEEFRAVQDKLRRIQEAESTGRRYRP
jgi:hypothetical protein